MPLNIFPYPYIPTPITPIYPYIPFYTLLYPSIPFYITLYPYIPLYTLLYLPRRDSPLLDDTSCPSGRHRGRQELGGVYRYARGTGDEQ